MQSLTGVSISTSWLWHLVSDVYWTGEQCLLCCVTRIPKSVTPCECSCVQADWLSSPWRIKQQTTEAWPWSLTQTQCPHKNNLSFTPIWNKNEFVLQKIAFKLLCLSTLIIHTAAFIASAYRRYNSWRAINKGEGDWLKQLLMQIVLILSHL